MIISPSAISPYKIPTFQSGGAPFVGLLELTLIQLQLILLKIIKADYAGALVEVRLQLTTLVEI
jgi:hypothetical protein